MYKWITCETESDEEVLEDRFIPTKEEKKKHDKMNREAKKHMRNCSDFSNNTSINDSRSESV